MTKVLINDIDVEELLIKIGELIDTKIEKFNLSQAKEKVVYLTRFEVSDIIKKYRKVRIQAI